MKKLLILLFTLISFNTFAVEKKTTFTQDLFNEAQKNGKIVVIAKKLGVPLEEYAKQLKLTEGA